SVSIGSAATDRIGINRITSSGAEAASFAASGAGSESAYGSGAGSFNITSQFTTNAPSGSVTVNYGANSSARDIAAAINSKSDETGVTANARTVAELASLSTSGTVSFKLAGAGDTSSVISAVVADASDLSALADAINKESGKTGISAFSKGDKLE